SGGRYPAREPAHSWYPGATGELVGLANELPEPLVARRRCQAQQPARTDEAAVEMTGKQAVLVAGDADGVPVLPQRRQQKEIGELARVGEVSRVAADLIPAHRGTQDVAVLFNTAFEALLVAGGLFGRQVGKVSHTGATGVEP